MAAAGNEVAAIEQAFDDMIRRIGQQAQRAQRQISEHRERMASVAHDLRTPLTALHGHLAAMSSPLAPPADTRIPAAALAQHNQVRRLSPQLFKLEADVVQKFELGAQPVRARELLGRLKAAGLRRAARAPHARSAAPARPTDGAPAPS